jgi:hypothetical protein
VGDSLRYLTAVHFLIVQRISNSFLLAVLLGTQQSFNPEAFGRLTSRGIAVLFCEVLLLKGNANI